MAASLSGCQLSLGFPKGPLLFLLYVDNIHNVISNSTIQLLADDIMLYKDIITSSDQRSLQDDLHNVYEWSRKWQLKLNPSKCESICISYQCSPLLSNYVLNGDGIASKPVVRYLGVHINTHLKWNFHVKYVTAKASCYLNFLRHSLIACSSAVKAVSYKCIRSSSCFGICNFTLVFVLSQ